jgi:hypothetical protein
LSISILCHDEIMDFIVFCLIFSYPVYRLVRHERMKRYFASPVFLAQKQEVAEVVAEHNEISAYVAEIRENGNFSIGRSSTGSQAVLASYNNTSRHNYQRNRNVADYASSNVHNCGLQVVRNASADPIKYLIKYFDIAANEEKLAEIESMGESISRLENALQNLESREVSIATTISPPVFIVKHYLAEFQAQIGLSIPKLTIPYPNYVFQYVSAGGNSSQETRIKLDSPTIDVLIQALSEKIKFKKSAAGQRSLMTARLREYIKNRDNYACKICSVSIHDQTHLLLEVDHIMPVSKGGLSIEENLQTLCWKCNRSKSNKF